VPLLWVALGGFAYTLDGASARGAAARGAAFGFAANVVVLRFVPGVIARFTPLPYVAGIVALALLALAQSLGWAAAGAVRALLARRRVPAPLAFACGVYAMAFVPAVFPWTPAAGFALWPALAQLADVVGEPGICALLALSAGLLAATRTRPFTHVAMGLALPLVLALHGRARMKAIDAERAAAPTAKIGLVDALVPATTRCDPAMAPSILANLSRQTELSESRGADLTVWPESAYPYVLLRGDAVGPRDARRPLQHHVRGPLAMGAVTEDPQGEKYNAVLAVQTSGTLAAEYDKLHLLWFGEEVPLAAEIPWIRRTFARGMGLLPGDRQVLLDFGRVKAAALICFEDVLPAAAREAGAVGPNLLVNVSNDAWFAGSIEPELHLRAATMRAIETRRDFVRAVNVGPTSFVDAAGRTRADHESTFPSALVVTAALLGGPPTFYVRFGDGPTAAGLAALALALALSSANGTKSKSTKAKGRLTTS
jgi:apolipoprotein N-acyltransferase